MELTPKKESNYNDMATWLHYVMLIITFNNILLSPPIALIYHLVPDGSFFWYTKPYLFIIGKYLSYILLLRSIPAIILFVG